MSAPIPSSKPRATLAVVMAAALAAWKPKHANQPLPELFVLGVRAYYRDTMGRPGTNDTGLYDDALFIVSPFGFSAWNANTDPSRYGWNPGAGKFMARLACGVWVFQRLKHHASRPDGYLAFGQGESPVTVERIREDSSVAMAETGCFGINLHRGGINGTSSEGCCTVPAEQWPAFDQTLATALSRTGARSFPFLLIEGPIV